MKDKCAERPAGDLRWIIHAIGKLILVAIIAGFGLSASDYITTHTTVDEHVNPAPIVSSPDLVQNAPAYENELTRSRALAQNPTHMTIEELANLTPVVSSPDPYPKASTYENELTKVYRASAVALAATYCGLRSWPWLQTFSGGQTAVLLDPKNRLEWGGSHVDLAVFGRATAAQNAAFVYYFPNHCAEIARSGDLGRLDVFETAMAQIMGERNFGTPSPESMRDQLRKMGVHSYQ